MKQFILAASVLVLCASAAAQNTKPQDLKPAATKERSAEEIERNAQKEREAAKERQRTNNADAVASPGAKATQRPGAGDPEVEAKRQAMEEERIKVERERAMKQREEALARSGSAGRDRERFENAYRQVDPNSLDKTTVEKEHEEAHKEAQAAIARLAQRADELQSRMQQLKDDVRAQQAAGATEEELKADFERIERLGALLNRAENELQFLMSVSKKNPDTQVQDKK